MGLSTEGRKEACDTVRSCCRLDLTPPGRLLTPVCLSASGDRHAPRALRCLAQRDTGRDVTLGDGRKSFIVVASMNVQQLDFPNCTVWRDVWRSY